MTDILADASNSGSVIPLLKMATVLVFAIPWLLACPWVNKDTKFIHAPGDVWSLFAIAGGLMGFLIWLVLPVFIVGLLAYLVLVGASLGAYVVYRNGRVRPEMRVLTADHFRSVFSREPKSTLKVETKVKIYCADGKGVTPPDPEQSPNEEIEAYNLAQMLLYELLFYRASEADLSPAGQDCRVRFVIDGVINERPPIELPKAELMMQFLKPPAGLNAEDRRRPQQGKISVDLAGAWVDMMVTTAGTTGGQRMQFKIVQEFVQTHIEKLGMTDEVLAGVREITQGKGLLIVAGRPGSGVTSTLYSILRAQDAFTKQLTTLEDKPPVEMENVVQQAYGTPDKLAGMLASTLRRDPEVVMVDQCPDTESAQMIAQAASDKLLLLGMSAPEALMALAKWVKLCGDPALATENLQGVLCQMLVRKLCPTCREAYRPDPQFLAKANLSGDRIDKFYRPPSQPLVDEKGRQYTCPTCQGNGYFGRTSVFELLRVNDDIRRLIVARAPLAQLQAVMRKAKMFYLQEQALRRVMEGVTSIQEVIRVSQQGKKAKED